MGNYLPVKGRGIEPLGPVRPVRLVRLVRRVWRLARPLSPSKVTIHPPNLSPPNRRQGRPHHEQSHLLSFLWPVAVAPPRALRGGRLRVSAHLPCLQIPPRGGEAQPDRRVS